jgi:hypothetical protein
MIPLYEADVVIVDIDPETLLRDPDGRECGNGFIPQNGDYWQQDMLLPDGARVTVTFDVAVSCEDTELIDWDSKFESAEIRAL